MRSTHNTLITQFDGFFLLKYGQTTIRRVCASTKIEHFHYSHIKWQTANILRTKCVITFSTSSPNWPKPKTIRVCSFFFFVSLFVIRSSIFHNLRIQSAIINVPNETIHVFQPSIRPSIHWYRLFVAIAAHLYYNIIMFNPFEVHIPGMKTLSLIIFESRWLDCVRLFQRTRSRHVLHFASTDGTKRMKMVNWCTYGMNWMRVL